jgi:hypothetical protein
MFSSFQDLRAKLADEKGTHDLANRGAHFGSSGTTVSTAGMRADSTELTLTVSQNGNSMVMALLAEVTVEIVIKGVPVVAHIKHSRYTTILPSA